MTTAIDTTASSSPAKKPGPAGWALLAPLLIWLVLFVVLPTFIMVVISFCQRDELGEVVYQWTLDNYRRVLDAHQAIELAISLAVGIATAGILLPFIRRRGWITCAAVTTLWIVLNVLTFQPTDSVDANWLKISVLSINYALISTAICVIAGYPVAYFIGRAPQRFRNGLLMLVMIPFWTSFLIRTYAWVTILRNEGLLNSLLQWLHIINDPLQLYPSQTGVMIGLVYTYLPFMILPIYTSIERLDNALIDAALDLGASPMRAFRDVILPLTRPGIVAGIVLVFVPAVGMFAVNDILGGRQQMLIGNVIERQFTAARDKPFGAALGMLLLLLFIITYSLTTRRHADA